MRRIGVFLLLMMFGIRISAQTQQGIVKTPTRRNVNGTMTQGQYIPNATITVMLVNNNTKQSHVSGNRGKFSFYAPSPYYITSITAQKGSYTFLDADFAKKQRQYSNNVVEVLVDDSNVLAKVRDEAIAYERSKIRKQIRAKEDEIEALKEANKITTAEYNKMLGELSEYRKSSEAIVQQIAEVYATTDFDKMDDFNKKLLAFVEEGNFKSADSLLRTQGSKEELFEKIKKEEQAIKKTEDDVNRAKEYNNQEKEALARRLYSEHLMFLQKPLMQDSALYCLKMRADLDATNINAVLDYANLCSKQKKYSECEKYYMICRDEYSRIDNDLGVADINCRLGYFYNDINDYAQSYVFFFMALKAYELLSEDVPDAYNDRIALTHAGMALNASNRKDYQESETHRQLALKYNEQLFKKNPDSYRANLMFSQLETGALYMDTGKLVESEKYYNLALQNCEILYGQTPEIYRDAMAGIKASLGVLYCQAGDYTKGEQYSISALEIYRQLAQQNPDAYLGMKANIEGSLGALYASREDYATCEKYYKQALADYKIAASRNPEIYLDEMANVESSLGLNYGYLKDFAGAEKYLKLAYEHYELLFQQKPKVYRAGFANACSNLGLLYMGLNDLISSEKYYKLALAHYEQLFKQNQDAFRASLAITQKQLGSIYGHLHDYTTSIQYYKQAIIHYEQMFSADPDAYRKDLAKVQSDLGILYGFAFQDRDNGAKYFMSAIKNYEQLYKQNPSLFVSEYGNILNNLAYIYAGSNKYNESLKAIDKAIKLMSDNAEYYDTKGEILLMQGKNQEAFEIWKKVLELNPDFLKNKPDGTNLSNGLKKLGLL